MNLYPTTGIPAINTLYVVEGCEHPAAAKLLIRFMMGGIDGDTSGYEPFNTLGGWPVRDDIEPAEGSVPYEGDERFPVRSQFHLHGVHDRP